MNRIAAFVLREDLLVAFLLGAVIIGGFAAKLYFAPVIGRQSETIRRLRAELASKQQDDYGREISIWPAGPDGKCYGADLIKPKGR